MTYEEQLQTPYWLSKRLEILERDDYCCQDCLRGKDRISPYIKLHVHHKKYIKGLLAWEYPNNLLITLCTECHGKFHRHIKDTRPERLKPSFVFGERDFESSPIRHVADVMREFIKSLKNG